MATHFINGEWIDSDGEKFQSINPANNETIWEGTEASSKEVDEAVEAARNSFEKWSALSLEKRLEYLEKFTELLKENRDELKEIISKETGKPLWESNMEVGGMINKLKVSLSAFHERTGIKEQEINNGRSIVRHRAHGVVAVFGPFNFPGHISNGHIIPALLAGNTVVFKPSEQTPLTAEKIVQLWEKSALPKGVLNLVQGDATTGVDLSSNSDINGLFFTGSSKTGTALNQQFAGSPDKILALEMGGNNPLLVFETKDLDAAVYLTIQSAYLTAGQRCVCARRLIVPQGKEGDEFLNKLELKIRSIKVGDYQSQPEAFMGPLISKKAADNVLEEQETLIKSGAQAIVPVERIKEDTAFLSPGLLDITNIPMKEDLEIFGPLLQVIRVKDFKEAIKEANNTSYGLSAGLISDSEKLYEEFLNKIKAGIVNWNNQLTGASSSAPFGGIGDSGNHRPSAYYAADYCSYPIASMESKELKMPEKLSPGLS
jgi:succinylglutamic semialdehyde dehydrogenase